MGRRPLPAVRDLTYDGRWNTFDENVLKLSKVSFRGVIRTLQSNININYPPQSQLLTYNGRSAGIPRSWCLLLITGLVALGSAKRYGYPIKLPSSEKLARLCHFPPASQARRLAGPVSM
jgi:hypothetical protein